MLDQLSNGARVLIIRLRSLGDCVLTTPALELLREYRPDLDVRVMVDDAFREIFDDLSMKPTLANALRFRPALAINLHGGTRSMQLCAATLARHRAGFAHHSASWAYSIKIPRAQEILGVDRKVHTAEHIASAMFCLGVPTCDVPRANLSALPASKRAPYAVIHPFAATPEKTWPPARFAQLAGYLETHLRLKPVFIGSAQDDFARFSRWEKMQGASLSAVKSLLSKAALFIGNDSGPAHMAAAFGIPVIVFFGPSDPVVWAPWRTEHERLVADGPCANITYEQGLEALTRLAARV